jgi:hypothetical protein
LSDAFILSFDAARGYPVRVAGTRVCALFDRELRGEPFLRLWAADSRTIIAGLLAILGDERVGTVAGANGRSRAGDPIDLELLLLPLEVPSWLGVSPVGPLSLGSRRHVGAALGKGVLPRFLTPRSRRGLVVYDGGRSS